MRSNKPILLGFATLFFAAGIWAGCTVGFDPNGNPQAFPCESNDDCTQGHECSDDGKVCQKISVGGEEAPPCDASANGIDQDGDGYGTGDNRVNCDEDKRREDCDDSDPGRYPGAGESCDGKDNDCDGEGADGADRIDEFDCETVTDCGDPPSNLASYLDFWECTNNTCVMRPFDQTSELSEGGSCGDITVTCSTAEKAFEYTVNGQSYVATEGPVLECR